MSAVTEDHRPSVNGKTFKAAGPITTPRTTNSVTRGSRVLRATRSAAQTEKQNRTQADENLGHVRHRAFSLNGLLPLVSSVLLQKLAAFEDL